MERSAVLFRGYPHSPLNLQVIPSIGADLEEHLKKPFGTKTVHIEAAGWTFDQANLMAGRVRERGFVYRLVHSILVSEERARRKRFPMASEEQISQRIEQVDSLDWDACIQQGLIPIGDIQDYALAKELDRLRTSYGFETRFEGHSPEIYAGLKNLARDTDYQLILSKNAWNRGDLNDSLGIMRNAEITVMQGAEIRDSETVEIQDKESKEQAQAIDLKDFITAGLAVEGKGLLATISGGSHALSLSRRLKTIFSSDLPLDFIVEDGMGLSPECMMYPKLGGHFDFTDHLAAQLVLHEQIIDALEKQYRDNNKLGVLANRWQDMYFATGSLVLSLDLPEIARLCRERVDLTNYVQTHPKLSGVRPLLLEATN